MNMEIVPFFDPATSTYSYMLADTITRQCALIDPVLDYDPASGRTSTASADRLLDLVREKGLRVQWILETHVHADHLSAGHYLREQLGGRLAIGEQVRTTQQTFGALFNVEPEFARDGSQFDHLFRDGESFQVGTIQARALHTPGHTPACMSYLIGDAVFVGDTLFMPDYGTARCDFPGGNARTLYRSIHQKLFTLPDTTRVFLCHDYLSPGRDQHRCETTIGEQRRGNIHVHAGVDEDSFVTMRQARDTQLNMPTLILPSVQVNMRAGQLPPAEQNGTRYLKIPLDAL